MNTDRLWFLVVSGLTILSAIYVGSYREIWDSAIQTATAPFRPAHFDWELCSTLHNQLLDIGWEKANVSRTRDTRSWWEFHWDNNIRNDNGRSTQSMLEELERRFPPDLTRFLKTAQNDNPGDPNWAHFFWGFWGLSWPSEMLDWLDKVDDSSKLYQAGRHGIMLYRTSTEFSRSMGILFGVKENKAFSLWSINWASFDPEKDVYVPLESILQGFLDMVAEKRVEAFPVGYGPPDWTFSDSSPWYRTANYDIVLPITLKAWDRLVETIESKLPNRAPRTPILPAWTNESLSEAGLAPNDRNDEYAFFRAFLSQMRQPRFSYVAPGLRLSLLHERSIQEFNDRDVFDLSKPHMQRRVDNLQSFDFPFLFLRADDKFLTAQQVKWEWPFDRKERFLTGLYLQRSHCYPDGAKLVLPMEVGIHGWARRSDGTRLDQGAWERSRPAGLYDGLYSPGDSHVYYAAQLRLANLLDNWRKMVERGYWKVGKHGVKGGIKVFQEADSWQMWKRYQIDTTW
ncbi:hypothetical protein BT63DRAFT_461151 [Microthyrium microscopicum]|uniref:Uncharacterized protein n=1 Tax=Microthyrium microscopicum TaxID=703497 RepID=A0A6A6TWT7_9PEZI|nr:hypothetical protein BT63DRAFT_461151 [Microthyrium microscopicum]